MRVLSRIGLALGLVAGAMLAGCDEAGTQVERIETSPGDAATVEATNYLDVEHAPRGEGWIRLFNGTNLEGWRPRDPNIAMSWRAEDGLLRNTSDVKKHDGVDLVSEPTFDDFEIYLEYRVPRGSNSGVYLRGRYEIQILEDFGKPPRDGSNGGIYSLAVPAKNVSREPGQWQSIYARLVGRRVNVWVNGFQTVQDVELTRATGGELDQNHDAPGPIMLQGNHGSVDFRHILIRPIPRQ